MKHLDDYSRVISNFRDGKVNCTSPCEEKVQIVEATGAPSRVQSIWGTHCAGGGVIILFLMNTDVPLLHEGYVFKDYEEGSNCGGLYAREVAGSHLPYVRHITGHWYRFADQPGF